jgi:hypothetical protein
MLAEKAFCVTEASVIQNVDPNPDCTFQRFLVMPLKIYPTSVKFSAVNENDVHEPTDGSFR